MKVKSLVSWEKRTDYISLILAVGICIVLLISTGCETKAQTGVLAGAGIGALAGQAIGRSTSGTLIGTAVGAGAGYIIGNEMDKKDAKTYDYSTSTPLTGTRWRVTRLEMDQRPLYEMMTVYFRNDGVMVTTERDRDGTTNIIEEHYRVVGDTLIISKPGYMINARYRISGRRMTITSPEFSAEMERI